MLKKLSITVAAALITVVLSAPSFAVGGQGLSGGTKHSSPVLTDIYSYFAGIFLI
jgi:hypothetical protein